jgi:hypothetical protein
MNTVTIIVIVVFGVLFIGVIVFMLSISFRLKKLREKLEEEQSKREE